MNAYRRAGAAALWICLSAAAFADDWVYRIQPGDTLIDLTKAYLQDRTRWRELQRINKVADPLKLPLGGSLRMPIKLLRREASVATVVFTQGDASVIRPPTAAAPLQTGAELRAGDQLRTGEAGSMSLRFVDGSRLLIAPGSEVSIEQLLVYGRSAVPSMHLRLNKGSADSKVEKQPQRPADYEIRTPQLNLGVRGTEFRVQVSDDGAATRAEVLEGTVSVNKLAVNAGFGVFATQGLVAPQLGRLPAAPDLSAVAATLARIPLSIGWASQPGVTAWRAQVFAEADFERLLLDGLFPLPQAVWADLPDGRYTLRVRAIDALGLEGLASDRLFTLKARPEPPFSRAPAADAVIYGEQLDLAWTRPLNPVTALNFRLQVASTPDFATPQIDRQDLSDTELRLNLPPGRYYTRLASIAKNDDLGPFGDPQTLTMRPIPPAPALSPPEMGDNELNFRWAAATGAARYKLQWATDPEFKNLLAEPSTDTPTVSLPRPPAGSYYLRVQSIDAQGYAGPFGSAQQVDVPRSPWLWLLPVGLLLLAL